MRALLGVCLALGLVGPAHGARLDSNSANTLLGTTSCAGSSVNIDANTLYIDCTNNRVSLGDTDAATPLDVEGASQFGSGVNKTTITAAGGITLNGAAQLLVSTGSATVPGLGIEGDTDVGVYSPSGNTLSMTTGGTERLRIDSDGAVMLGATVGAPSSGTLIVRSTSVTAGNPVLDIRNNAGTELLRVQQNGQLILRQATGLEGTPSLDLGSNDGFYAVSDVVYANLDSLAQMGVTTNQVKIRSTGEFSWTSGGVEGVASDTALMRRAAAQVELNTGTRGTLGTFHTGVLQWGTGVNVSTLSTTGGITIQGAASLAVSTGNASVPGLTFNGDTNTGIYSTGADSLNFTTGGAQAGSFNSAQTLILLAPTRLFSRTALQIDTLTPVAAGDVIFCSNCATSGDVCVSTGTAAAQWRRIGTTAGCGSNG